MEVLAAGYEIIEQKPGIDGIYEAIELPGRICYHSQDKIAPGTAKTFVENGLMKSNHGAPMEHGEVCLECPEDVYMKYETNPYSKVKAVKVDTKIIHYMGDYIIDTYKYYVTTNFRVLFENGWLDDLKYLCEPTPYHERRVMVRFTIDRFTGEEYLRHRRASFNRESTRYVNFTKDKFGGGSIKFIRPIWLAERADELDKVVAEDSIQSLCQSVFIETDTSYWSDIDYWVFALKATEYSYNNLIRLGWAPEQARTVLPCAISSPLIKTAFLSDWIHFFNLRALGKTGKPHPQAKELAEPLMYDFIERGLIKFDDNNKLVIA